MRLRVISWIALTYCIIMGSDVGRESWGGDWKGRLPVIIRLKENDNDEFHSAGPEFAGGHSTPWTAIEKFRKRGIELAAKKTAKAAYKWYEERFR